MAPHTFVLMGKSGCGKGTQAKLLREYIEANDAEKRSVFYLETGERFREFIKGKTFSSRLAGEVYKTGAPQPAFLAVWNWAHLLVDFLTGEEHLLVDGTPRSFQEALVFNSAIKFYGRVKPVIIHVDVSREWSKARMIERGRMDDISPEEVDKRLNWFETDVVPALDYFKANELYTFIRVNGEQSVEKVHADIMEQVVANLN